MKVINVYEQYFEGHCRVYDTDWKGVRVALVATSEEGTVRYEVQVNFFPHTEEDPFLISYDKIETKELYFAKGRRSKKREEAYMEIIRPLCDELAAKMDGTIDWDAPLIEARRG